MPALALSVLVAERAYKFGSFTLECIAFLATWYVVDALFALGRRLLSPRENR